MLSTINITNKKRDAEDLLFQREDKHLNNFSGHEIKFIFIHNYFVRFIYRLFILDISFHENIKREQHKNILRPQIEKFPTKPQHINCKTITEKSFK